MTDWLYTCKYIVTYMAQAGNKNDISYVQAKAVVKRLTKPKPTV